MLSKRLYGKHVGWLEWRGWAVCIGPRKRRRDQSKGVLRYRNYHTAHRATLHAHTLQHAINYFNVLPPTPSVGGWARREGSTGTTCGWESTAGSRAHLSVAMTTIATPGRRRRS